MKIVRKRGVIIKKNRILFLWIEALGFVQYPLRSLAARHSPFVKLGNIPFEVFLWMHIAYAAELFKILGDKIISRLGCALTLHKVDIGVPRLNRFEIGKTGVAQ